MEGTDRLISFEGMEASGKSTQAKKLAKALRQKGQAVLLLREPGGSDLGEAIRKLLMCETSQLTKEAELLLFAASRAQLVRQHIQPSLKKKQWVLCDRFLDSTLAYQGYGRGLPNKYIEATRAIAVGNCLPRLTFVLDLPVSHALERLKARGGKKDCFENQNPAFHQAVRTGYLNLAKQEPKRICVLNALLNPQRLHEDILDILKL